MRLSDYDYVLPRDRIAQEPLPRRDASRLLVLDRDSGSREHRVFSELPDLLASGDLLVLNDTRVVPSRLRGRKASGGRMEAFLVERIEEEGPRQSTWRCLLARPPRTGGRFTLGEGIVGEVLRREVDTWLVRLTAADADLDARLASLGEIPLPPYIERELADPRSVGDREHYQTVYARVPGATAAPTAGLHVTPELLLRLEAAGIELTWLTLHVGLGTFLPIRPVADDRVDTHTIHEEAYDIPEDTSRAIARVRAARGRVIAVGTTVVRALEARALEGGEVRPGGGRCTLFIRPGFRFRVVDGLVTNFHLPRSTLLLLVAAFAGREHVLDAYREAVRLGYRFYSYGDAMFVRPAPC